MTQGHNEGRKRDTQSHFSWVTTSPRKANIKLTLDQFYTNKYI